ncbi:MAG: GTP 3',8-cyclase MoaA [Bacillota bacterium]
MKDPCGRTIDYIRISITDRCNLRCMYCMPETGVLPRAHHDVLRYEELERVVSCARDLGIGRVRVTGGEPLVRLGLPGFIRRIAALPGIEEVSMTTNGQLLSPMARELKAAGLARVNISLDTLNPETFDAICRRGGLDRVLAGIDAALDAGLVPVKVNMVVMKGINDHEVADFAALTLERPLHVRFIELMPLGDAGDMQPDCFVPASVIRARLEAQCRLHPSAGVTGNGPARYYRLEGGKGTVGFIAPLSEHFCGACNRLRLSSTGGLSPCLGSPDEVDLREPLRNGASDEEIRDLIRRAILAKPAGHDMANQPDRARRRRMHRLGG